MGPVPTRAAELLPTAPIETPLEIVLNRYCIRATVPAPVVDRLTVRAELWLDRIGQTVQRIARDLGAPRGDLGLDDFIDPVVTRCLFVRRATPWRVLSTHGLDLRAMFRPAWKPATRPVWKPAPRSPYRPTRNYATAISRTVSTIRRA